MWTKQEKVKLYFRPLLNFTLAKEVREKKLRIFFPGYYRHSQPVATVGKQFFPSITIIFIDQFSQQKDQISTDTTCKHNFTIIILCLMQCFNQEYNSAEVHTYILHVIQLSLQNVSNPHHLIPSWLVLMKYLLSSSFITNAAE